MSYSKLDSPGNKTTTRLSNGRELARNFLRKWKWFVANQRTRKEAQLHGLPDAALRLELWVFGALGREARRPPALRARPSRLLRMPGGVLGPWVRAAAGSVCAELAPASPARPFLGVLRFKSDASGAGRAVGETVGRTAPACLYRASRGPSPGGEAGPPDGGGRASPGGPRVLRCVRPREAGVCAQDVHVCVHECACTCAHVRARPRAQNPVSVHN